MNEAPPFLADRIEAIVLDWAGTTVDYGSRAPIAAIVAAFEQAGFPVSEAEAREPMGRAKREHLQAMLADSEVAARWQEKHGRPSTENDVDQIYTSFLSLQAECVTSHSDLIPGCKQTIETLRERGLKIGSSTGYTRELLAPVAERTAGEGYKPDVMLSADDVSPGRPAPWLIFENARRLGVYPMSSIVKVDDTRAGVTAGRNAGCWAIGVVNSGNEVGLSQEVLSELSPEERDARLCEARQRLTDAGAHLLIDTIADLPEAIDAINDRLAEGLAP